MIVWLSQLISWNSISSIVINSIYSINTLYSILYRYLME